MILQNIINCLPVDMA